MEEIEDQINAVVAVSGGIDKLRLNFKNLDLEVLKEFSSEKGARLHTPTEELPMFHLQFIPKKNVFINLSSRLYNINEYYTLKGAYEEE